MGYDSETEMGSRTLFFVPNTVTAANIAVGFISLLAAAAGQFDLAAYLLVAAILLDAADGRIARLLNATSKFGQEMDSLSDALSFGVAPAFLVHQAILLPMRGFGVVVSLIYLLAGVYRLARFNMTSDAHAKSRTTTGVPIPVAAGYMIVLVLMREHFSPAAAAAVVLLMAMLMVSRIHLPEFHGRGLLAASMIVGLFNFIAVVVWPNWYTAIWWNVWCVVILLAARFENRRLELSESST